MPAALATGQRFSVATAHRAGHHWGWTEEGMERLLSMSGFSSYCIWLLSRGWWSVVVAIHRKSWIQELLLEFSSESQYSLKKLTPEKRNLFHFCKQTKDLGVARKRGYGGALTAYTASVMLYFLICKRGNNLPGDGGSFEVPLNSKIMSLYYIRVIYNVQII